MKEQISYGIDGIGKTVEKWTYRKTKNMLTIITIRDGRVKKIEKEANW